MQLQKRWIALGVLVILAIAILLLGLVPVPAEAPAVLIASTAPHKNDCPPRSAQASASGSGTGQTRVVQPGGSIQDVVNQAQPGDTVQIMPGTFHEQVTITTGHLTLVGMAQNGQRPILDGQGKLGSAIIDCADQLDLEGLEIHNYTTNGVLAENVDGAVIRNVFTDHTGDYGFFPVHSKNITIEKCVATGAHDTGFYVGQSDHITVTDNEAYANVSGIELENTTNTTVTNNYSHDNTAGLLMFVLPDLETKQTSGNLASNNRLIANNLANFADKDDIVSEVPAGTGLALIGTNGNEVTANEIRDNNSTGIAVVSLADFMPGRKSFDVDPNPRDNWIHDNSLQNNGTNLDPAAKSLGLPGTDLLWDANGWNNSWQETAQRRFPPILPGRDWNAFERRLYNRVLSVLRLLP